MNLPEIITDLFELNLRQVAKKFGLIEHDVPALSASDAAKILNLAEDYSFQASDEERMLSLILCAMVWENRQDEWYALGPFVGRILIRLGLGTSDHNGKI